MVDETLLHLARDLEWLGVELEYYGKKHALEGFPGAGHAWDIFLEKQRGVLTTIDKIDRELKGLIRFNPSLLVGVNFPLAQALDSIGELLAAVEEIKQSAQSSVHELPSRVRQFTKMVSDYSAAASSLAG